MIQTTDKNVFDESSRFSPYYIRLSEMIYGRNFQSPGGDEFLDKIFSPFRTGEKFSHALDIGFGCGGNSIWLNRNLGCSVTGIDINGVFIDIAPARIKEAGAAVNFRKESVLDLDEVEKYDMVICRDVLMYILEKNRALINIHNAMVDGGKLVLIDYCRRQDELSGEFQGHIQRGKFQLSPPGEYKLLLQRIGFRNVILADITDQYISYMEKALLEFDSNTELPDLFREDDINYIRERTVKKIGYCTEGSMIWAALTAEK